MVRATEHGQVANDVRLILSEYGFSALDLRITVR
jgi:hypothetical protein